MTGDEHRITVTRRDGGGAVRQRPWTHDYVDPDGMTHMTVKRCCNGCARQLGDATDAEMEAAVTGLPLPDVTGECGCGRVEL